MDVEIRSNDEMKFLYRLSKGITNASYGIHCAKIAGIPVNVIQRAKQIANLLQSNGQIIPLDCKRNVEPLYDYLIDQFINCDIQNKNNVNELLLLIDSLTKELHQI